VDLDVCLQPSDCAYTFRDFDFHHVVTERIEFGCCFVNVVLIEPAKVTDPVILGTEAHAISMDGAFSATQTLPAIHGEVSELHQLLL
jgi:hypothetical protein